MLPNLNIKAYIARMKNASLPEIAYRVNQAFTVRRMWNRVSAGKKAVHVPLPDETRLYQLRMPSFVMEVDETVIDAILGGMTFSLNGKREALEQLEALLSGTYFADIRLTPETPDIRMAWEPARLQHLTILLIHVSQNPGRQGVGVVKSFARSAILSWIRQNPFLHGPHYMSPMECGLRIPVFFYALKTLDNLTTGERREILDALYLHAWWVSRNVSLYSSLGNHTIGECLGLVFAGAVFQKFEEGRKWLESGVRLLKKEAQRQILDDGGPIEQSLAYHRFVLDIIWLVIDFLERNALEDFTVLKPRLSRAEAFLDSFRDEQGFLPLIGDSDDGHAVSPGVVPKREQEACGPGAVETFPDAGYTAIRTPVRGLLTFDHGPLGMPPLYNHGHADALSLTLSIGDRGFLVDAGTYQYNGERIWRHYFKSTRAHNTVTVDGQDQADQETGFVWSRPYAVRVIRNDRHDGILLIEAEHDGYARLDRPVVHRRAICHPDDSVFLVSDHFAGQGVHEFELNWHLHPNAVAKKQGDGWWRIENGDIVLYMRLMGGKDFDLLCGGTDPIKGWYSSQYGIKEACSVLTLTVKGEPAETEFVTVICTGMRIGAEQIRKSICRMRTGD
jgi:hypothetical protein